ncbi:universal stress protein [Haloquadratum walsbyi]|jgi:Universal stress protein UspA and related nucleotide-binding proteins|uniref:Universal stress protein UspA related nucleotide-binding protein n=1 Tax=Haloquadratum walsbyi J07HQW2 TaxID=1238425 RepID=U1NDG7_9EURY|nr:universal stress protein [Haloquadratum walsbyi]ERG95010.1 MAG: universal stress protein UspA related nucleotide-binding protein [Haloquadratum walsbyi J07HQW2]
MFNRILLPTDGTDAMQTVIDHVVDIATRRDAVVHILYVVDDRAFLTLQDGMKADVIAELETEGEATLETTTRLFHDSDITTTTALRKGDPADEIISYATEADIDLITMGTRRSDYTENLVGSVSQSIVARADIPVLTTNLTHDDDS